MAELSTYESYECKKSEICNFAWNCVLYNLETEQLRILCSYPSIAIKIPSEEWTNSDSLRSSVWWALTHQGIIEAWRQRPHKLVEVLRNVLHRDDLANKLQELLDKYSTVINSSCTRSSSTVVISEKEEYSISVPTQETAGHVIDEETSSIANHEDKVTNEPSPEKTAEDVASKRPVSIASSGFYDYAEHNYGRSRSETMTSNTSEFSMHLNRNDSGFSAASMASTLQALQTKHDLDSGSTCTGSAQNSQPSPEGSNSLTSSSTSSSSSSSNESDLVQQVTIFSKMESKKRELIKIMESSKQNWSHTLSSANFPDLEKLPGHPVQYRVTLCPQMYQSAASNQTCSAMLSLELIPVSHDTVHISPMTVIVSAYMTGEKGTMTGFNITNAKQNVAEATIGETTEIAQFPELVTLDYLKSRDEKYIVIEVSIIYT